MRGLVEALTDGMDMLKEWRVIRKLKRCTVREEGMQGLPNGSGVMVW